jgi:hypothetical protein
VAGRPAYEGSLLIVRLSYQCVTWLHHESSNVTLTTHQPPGPLSYKKFEISPGYYGRLSRYRGFCMGNSLLTSYHSSATILQCICISVCCLSTYLSIPSQAWSFFAFLLFMESYCRYHRISSQCASRYSCSWLNILKIICERSYPLDDVVPLALNGLGIQKQKRTARFNQEVRSHLQWLVSFWFLFETNLRAKGVEGGRRSMCGDSGWKSTVRPAAIFLFKHFKDHKNYILDLLSKIETETTSSLTDKGDNRNWTDRLEKASHQVLFLGDTL